MTGGGIPPPPLGFSSNQCKEALVRTRKLAPLVVGLTAVALLLGGIPFVAKNIDLLAIVVVVASVLPLVATGLRRRGQNQHRELVDADSRA